MLLDTPVAFLIFNRPDLTERVFATIAQARPSKLLVVCDGPRHDRPGEAEKIVAARRVIECVDWPCEVLTDYSDVNLGCGRRISSGLDWVFNRVDRAIVLEDDCLPDPTFFAYCAELLERYRDDTRIMAISGDNFQEGRSRTDSSYFFSKYFHCWGWASWRRAWRFFDLRMRSWPEFLASSGLSSVCDSADEERYWTRIFTQMHERKIDTWDFPWLYACWAQGGLTIQPCLNLVSNIGARPDGTHVSRATRWTGLPTYPIDNLRHPRFVVRHKEADEHTFAEVFRGGKREKWPRRFARRLQRLAASFALG